MSTAWTAENLPTLGGVKLVTPKELSNEGTIMAIYGKGGTGKTTLCADTAKDAKYGPVLFVACDPGIAAISDMDNIVVVPCPDWNTFDKVTDDICKRKKETFPFKTIVVDNMTEVQRLRMLSLVGSGYAEIQHHGKCTADILTKTCEIRDFGARTGINIFFIAWDNPEKEESSGTIHNEMGFTPSLYRQFPGLLDYVGYLTVENDGTRVLTFAPNKYHAGKVRKNRLESVRTMPLVLYYNELKQNLIVDILNTIKGGEKFPSNKYTKEFIKNLQ